MTSKWFRYPLHPNGRQDGNIIVKTSIEEKIESTHKVLITNNNQEIGRNTRNRI